MAISSSAAAHGTVPNQRLAWVIVVFVALASAGCAVAPPVGDRYVAPSLGSTWIVSRVDTGSYGSSSIQMPMTRGERIWQGTPAITFETPENTLVTSVAGDYIAQVKDDTPLFSWDPPYNLDWPLQVGKSSKKSYRMTVHAANRTVSYDVEQRVEAYETVTTPAGTFKAFKVSSSDTLGNQNVDWISTELGIFVKRSLKRTAKHAQGPGTREMEVVSLSMK